MRSAVLVFITFLSTLPARGATSDAAKVATNYITISIHAPREGSDAGCRA